MTVAMAFWTGGCGHDHDGHDHHASILLTAYTPHYEAYAEISPLYSGGMAEILLHMTQLDDFKPLTEGSATLELEHAGWVQRAECTAPEKPGVFRFSLVPLSEGKGNFKVTLKLPDGSVTIPLGGVEIYGDEGSAEHEAEAHEVKSANAAVFTKEMAWKSDFATGEAVTAPVYEIIRTTARVESSAGDAAVVAARGEGLVRFAQSNLAVGSRVTAGETLFRIDGGAMAGENLKSALHKAENDLKGAKREYDRTAALAKENLATGSELTKAENDYENARTNYENLRTLSPGGVTAAVAPISGYITSINVSNGQYAAAGETLATVSANRDIYLSAEVSPALYPLLKQIRSANIRYPGEKDFQPLDALGGSIAGVGQTVTAENPLLPVTFRLRNDGRLVGGTFVEMNILAGDAAQAVTVPTDALTEETGNYFVYVQLTPELFEKRQVKTGRSDGIATEITSGLAPGERIVTKGAALVKLAHSAGKLDAHSGHVH